MEKNLPTRLTLNDFESRDAIALTDFVGSADQALGRRVFGHPAESATTRRLRAIGKPLSVAPGDSWRTLEGISGRLSASSFRSDQPGVGPTPKEQFFPVAILSLGAEFQGDLLPTPSPQVDVDLEPGSVFDAARRTQTPFIENVETLRGSDRQAKLDPRCRHTGPTLGMNRHRGQ